MIELLKIIIRWQKLILICCAAAVLGSFIISMPVFMPPYYESTAIIYPANMNQSNKQIVFGKRPADYFGLKEDVDRLVATSNSGNVADYIINKYNLMQHYKIDSTKTRFARHEVMEEFLDNYKAIRDENGGVKLSLYDTDRFLAAQILNDIIAKVDDMNRDFLHTTVRRIVGSIKTKIEQRTGDLRVLSDSLLAIRLKYQLAEESKKTLSSKSAKNFTEYAQGVEQYKNLKNQKESVEKELANFVETYNQYEAAVNNDAISLYILQKAFPAEKKSKPIRWLILTGSFLFTFFLTSLAAVLIEKSKELKQALKND